MLSHVTIHTLGAVVYGIFFAHFLWFRSIPRAPAGAGWWATSLLCIGGAHVAYLLLPASGLMPPSNTVYATFNATELACLLAGLIRCFRLGFKLRWLAVAWLVVEAGVWLGEFIGIPPFARGLGMTVVNTVGRLTFAWVLLRRRDELDAPWLLVAATTNALLALQWATYYPAIEAFPTWLMHSFLSGLALNMTQYFALLAALLQGVHRRLLQAESSALELAFRDPLTGLNNRRYMSTLFESALQLATRPHHQVAVLCLDLDDFKSINDTAGHQTGDEVLKTVAARLQKATRSTDICARMGGDEFVVICTQLEHEEQAVAIAQKLLEVLAEPIHAGARSLTPGVSIGISFYPKHARSLAELLKCADQAMYQAKTTGKRGYRLYQAASPDEGLSPQAVG